MGTRRLDRRQGFLISATVHVMILSLLMFEPKRPDKPKPGASPSPGATEPPRRVVLVRPDVLRQMLRPLPPTAEPRVPAPHRTREPEVALPPAIVPPPVPT